MLHAQRIIEISDADYHYTSGYYTANKWLDSDTIVLARSKNQTIGVRENPFADAVELVKVSLRDGSKTVLCGDVLHFSYVVWRDQIYYSNGYALKKIDAASGTITTVYENAQCRAFVQADRDYGGETCLLQQPHITNDGQWVAMFIPRRDQPSIFLRINTRTGEAENFLEKRFAHPFYQGNHLMPCPENGDVYFFAHEGTTQYISNRLWLYDCASGEARNIAPQRLGAQGDLIDCFGHEMWAPDGKGMYFVKYTVSPEPPRGICYVDAQSGEYELLYSGFSYWHVGVSPDGRYLTADTQGKALSEVIVIDREDSSETCIDSVPITWQHPCHPHPQLCADNTRVSYTCQNGAGRTCVKVALLEKDGGHTIK